MNTINIDNNLFLELSFSDLTLIDGGSEIDRNSTAYKMGQDFRKIADGLATIGGVVALFALL